MILCHLLIWVCTNLCSDLKQEDSKQEDLDMMNMASPRTNSSSSSGIKPFLNMNEDDLAYVYLCMCSLILIVISNAIYGRKRGPKVGSGRGQKRKSDDQYSQNAHTKKARARKENLSQAQKDIEAARARERQALSRKLKSVQKRDEFKTMSPDQQELYLQGISDGMKDIQYESILPVILLPANNY
jgi:hypothetical protein